MINEIEKLQIVLIKKFPQAYITLDKPLVENGVWSMDIFINDKHISVAWKHGKGFGLVYKDDHGYGEGADEVFSDSHSAYLRIIELMLLNVLS